VTDVDVKGAKALSERLAEAARGGDRGVSESRDESRAAVRPESIDTDRRACPDPLESVAPSDGPARLVPS